MLAGRRGFWKYDGRELEPGNAAGRRLRADVVMKRLCCIGARRLALMRADDMMATSFDSVRLGRVRWMLELSREF